MMKIGLIEFENIKTYSKSDTVEYRERVQTLRAEIGKIVILVSNAIEDGKTCFKIEGVHGWRYFKRTDITLSDACKSALLQVSIDLQKCVEQIENSIK